MVWLQGGSPRHVFRWSLFAALCLAPILGGCSGGIPITPASLGQQLLIGLVLGSVYALLALGYTLVYGVIKLINFAHSDIYMLGAFSGYFLLRLAIRHLHFNAGWSLPACFVVAAIAAAAICALLAVVMERLAYRPLRKSSRIAALITAVGVSFLLENGGIVAFGANPKSFEPKTLGVYQLELAGTDFAADPSDVQRLEVMGSTQVTVPVDEFPGAVYGRLRLVNRYGVSDWSQTFKIGRIRNESGQDEEQDAWYFETVLPENGPDPSPPARISARTRVKAGHSFLTLSWTEAAAEDTALAPVFSGKDGRPLALTFAAGQLRIPYYNLGIVGVTLLVLWGLNILVNKSMFGIAMRALSFDMNAAKLMGIDTDRCISQTFAIGGACAGLAGCMVGLYNQSIDPLMGILPGLKAFVAAVIGGIGSIPGAALGGLIMGVSESLMKGFIHPSWSSLSDALAFALLIVVLLFRPTGLLGSTVREKV